MIRILIADDHPLIRNGIIQVLTGHLTVEICGEFDTGASLLKQAATGNHDLVILDISLPDMNGIDILVQLKSSQPAIPVLIVSMHPVEQYAKRAMKKGAAGYLTKDAPPEEFINAVTQIISGKKYISQSLAEELESNLHQRPVDRPHELLSDREFQVMCMLARGNSISEIANHCCLSPKTISTYRTRILQKLGLRNTVQIGTYALENKLV